MAVGRRGSCMAIFIFLVWMLVATASAEATVLPATITENTTLTAAGGPYTGTGVTVASGATLTAEPGSVIKISGLLVVKGVLTVNGTAEAPVTITSRKDDSAGGDTNEDGSATLPKAGDWSGIEFPASTGGSVPSTLNHARILYGGAGGFSQKAMVEVKCPCTHPLEISHSYLAYAPASAVKINKGSLSITDSTIEGNAVNGIASTSASPHIYGNTISGNDIGISFEVGGEEHASVDINDNVVEDNASGGIAVHAAVGETHIDTASMGENVVEGNGGKAIVYEAFPNSSENSSFVGNPIPPNIATNRLSGNAKNGIWVSGRVAESTSWEAWGYPLVVFNNGLNIGKGSTLTLQAGTVIKNEGQSVYVNGTLQSEGSAESPVTFTSVKDDSVDGDTNGDGSATTPSPGNWRTLEFRSEAGPSSLVDTVVRYGGESVYPFESMIEVKCPCVNSLEFTGSTVAYSYMSGINLHAGAAASITGSTIDHNQATGIASISASPHIYGNTISDNDIGISFEVGSEEHASVDINDNVVEDNASGGIAVHAAVGETHIDTASLGENVVEGNGGKAIVYEAFPNSSENSSFVGNPIPPNIATNRLSGNTKNGIWVSGRVAESTSWEASGYPLVAFNNGLNIGKGSTLTLQAGTVIKNEGQSVYVNGALLSEGSAESPVIFTSVKDDSVDGDTNGDGTATTPAPGNWNEIQIPNSKNVELEYLDVRYAKIAFNLKYLDSMTVANSDFAYNEKAFEVAETANNSPELGALSCVPPYLSFVISEENWYGATGVPAPSIDISGAVGAVLPAEYAPLFGAAGSLAELDTSLYGTDDTIPFVIYSCPALGIPPTPFTPVIVASTPLAPHFPDPEVE